MPDNMEDQATPEAALAILIQEIQALPEDANVTNTSFGKRHESVGGGWYWSVTWSFQRESGRKDRRVTIQNRTKVISDTIGDALARIAEEKASA